MRIARFDRRPVDGLVDGARRRSPRSPATRSTPDRVDQRDVCRGRRAAPRAGDSSEQVIRDRQELPQAPPKGDGWEAPTEPLMFPHPQHIVGPNVSCPPSRAMSRYGERPSSSVGCTERRTRGCAEGRLQLHLRQRRHRPGPAEVRRAVISTPKGRLSALGRIRPNLDPEWTNPSSRDWWRDRQGRAHPASMVYLA